MCRIFILKRPDTLGMRLPPTQPAIGIFRTIDIDTCLKSAAVKIEITKKYQKSIKFQISQLMSNGFMPTVP